MVAPSTVWSILRSTGINLFLRRDDSNCWECPRPKAQRIHHGSRRTSQRLRSNHTPPIMIYEIVDDPAIRCVTDDQSRATDDHRSDREPGRSPATSSPVDCRSYPSATSGVSSAVRS